MTIDSDEDLDGLRRAGAVVAEARRAMTAAAVPGTSTAELDSIARGIFKHHGARSAPRLTYDFPGWTCISINDEAAHGVPAKWRVLKDGDIVNVDISAELDGYFADTGASLAVGNPDPVARHLLDATASAQKDATSAARVGQPLRAIGRAVQARARREGFNVVKNLFGHGVGRALHEEPSVPSFDNGARLRLWEGLVLAVEPFLSVSADEVVDQGDGWTLRTKDRSLVAQFEHTIVVTRGEPLLVTA
jgi:methionyl aminopeptidase